MKKSPKLVPGDSRVSMLALLLLAANLRPALTSVGPLVEPIRRTTHISLTAAGLLTSLPLIAFGLFAPLGHFGRHFGVERTVVAALTLLALGILIRGLDSNVALFSGSVCLAAGIALGNSLAPGIIKRDFSGQVKGATTLYAFTLGLAAAIGSGVAIPLSNWLPGGWRTALAFWAAPSLLAMAVWLPTAFRAPREQDISNSSPSKLVWRSLLAWQVTAFMGLQSFLFYVTIAWFPTLFQSRGYSSAEAGLLITVFQLAGLAASPIVPIVLKYAKDEALVALGTGLTIAAAIGGLLMFPGAAYFWMIVMGLGGTCSLTLALTFISLRVANHHDAATLSIMSQTIGYLLAATGPVAFGLIHELSGNWSLPLLSLAAIAILLGAVGVGAGQHRTL